MTDYRYHESEANPPEPICDNCGDKESIITVHDEQEKETGNVNYLNLCSDCYRALTNRVTF